MSQSGVCGFHDGTKTLGVEGDSFIWPKQICVAEQGMVF